MDFCCESCGEMQNGITGNTNKYLQVTLLIFLRNLERSYKFQDPALGLIKPLRILILPNLCGG